MFHVVLYIIYMNSTGASPVSWTKKKKACFSVLLHLAGKSGI